MPSFASGSINFHDVKVDGDFATVSFTVPYASIPLVKNLLDSLFSFSSYLNLKARHNKAIVSVSDISKVAEREKHYQFLVARVLESFNIHYDGSNYRVAVSAVKAQFVKSGVPLTCGVIDNLLKSERNKKHV